jgi:uncharacterized membrane protein YhaH (DUF805 family)
LLDEELSMTNSALSSRPSLWSELFTVRGRTNRGRMWLALLLLWLSIFVVVMPLALLARAQERAAPEDQAGLGFAIAVAVVVALAMVLFLVAGVLLAIRRLHDRDKSGHWLWLLYLLPAVLGGVGDAMQKSGANEAALLFLLPSFILSVWAFVELGCLRGTAGPNRFGPDPLRMEIPA